jgi:uncharacterized membrane protein SirB2
MDALAWVPPLRQAHLALVGASGALFVLRGLGALATARWPQQRALRIGSIVIDSLLLAVGVTLWAVLQLNPVRDHWLAAKLVWLLLYIALGRVALKPARSKLARGAAFGVALTLFATLLSVGWMRDALGFWRWLR